MTKSKISKGHYRIEANGKVYDIEKVEDTVGSNGMWDIFVTDSENNHEWSDRFYTKKDCIKRITEEG